MCSHETEGSCYVPRRCQHEGGAGDDKILIDRGSILRMGGDRRTPF